MNQKELDLQPDLVYTDEHGPYCKIPLSRGLFAKIDPEDFDLVTMFKWHACKSSPKSMPDSYYAMYSGFRYEDDGKRTRYCLLMHRIILAATEKSQHVDHADHDTLNNRKYNIRITTVVKNAWNRKGNRTNASGLKGAVFNPKNSKWVSRISVNKRYIHLGTFNTPQEANEAYRKAAIRYFGEFACA